MKIVNINPGLLPIPPNGWGAIEKIIWEIHQNLLLLGHDSKILYTDQVNKGDFDIVHVHVANLANMLHAKGIPYIFSFHDHHAFLYGKNSPLFQENMEAIRNSMLTLVPAKFLVDYFDSPKVIYFSHGVNTQIFKRPIINTTIEQTHKLLCVANNGWAGDPSADRKGFSFAIQAARELGLPLTIAGPKNNKNYFDAVPPDYDNLNIIYDLNEEQLINLYKEHTIFLHPSILEAGHPNLTLLEAMSCGLPVVGTYENNNNLDGMVKVERDVSSIKKGILEVINNFYDYRRLTFVTSDNLSWKNRTLSLVSIYNQYINKDMKDILIDEYEKTQINYKEPIKPLNSVNISFIGNPKVEILGSAKINYKVNFIDNKNDTLYHSADIGNNMWTSCSIKYCKEWRIEVIPQNAPNEKLVHIFNPTRKRVYIAFESSSLGDSLAWIPVVEEFRKKWDCEVTCSTFKNDLFKNVYPQINFVNPGESVPNLYAMFTIGWYYFQDGKMDLQKNPKDFRSIPLQQTASDILGMDYKEIAPKVDKTNIKRNIEGKYVCIAPHASSLAKYWNRSGGWQAVIDHLNDNGYKVVYISQEPLNDEWHDSKLGGTLKGVIDKSGDIPLSDRISDIAFADYFIGVGSGLSWLAWAIGTRVMMISGFSKPFTEFNENCDRIFNESVCNGCFNTHKLDPGDWRWCPLQKGTPREFECTKVITEHQIIKVLKERL